jgi:hypothetical protein
MDRFNLRIIANPYFMKKKILNSKNNSQIELENNELLYQYLDSKYKEIYIPPILYYNIINVIETIIRDYEIELVVKEIIDGVIHNAIHSDN